MRNILLLILCFCLTAANVQAQPAGYKPVADMPLFRKKMEQSAAKTQSIKSEFDQEKSLEAISEIVISKGSFRFKKPGRIRMEYHSPYRYLMIINGEKITIRDDRKTNSFSSKGNKLFTIINNIILDCMQGTALDNKEFRSTVFENDKQFLIVMSPVKKELRNYFDSIQIYLSGNNLEVTMLEMNEPSGDKTKISFINRELNVNIPDSDFIVK